jgi:hypothetical protein
MAFELYGGIFLEKNDELHLERLYGMFLFLVERHSTCLFIMRIPFNLETLGGGRFKTFEPKLNWPPKLLFSPKTFSNSFYILGLRHIFGF